MYENHIILLTLYTVTAATMHPDFGVVIDAGSSGSRARVYRLDWTVSTDVPSVLETFENKVKPGISAYSDRIDELEDYVVKLIDAVTSSGYIPHKFYSTTPIYFMATAGMRLLLEEKATAVMDKIHKILSDRSKNPFNYELLNTRILSGEEEGAFAWITANYINGFLLENREESVGVLELGGASTQIAFIPRGSPLANKFPVVIGSRQYPLYVHSYLYYGQEYAMRWSREYLVSKNPGSSQIENPCMLHDDMLTTDVNDKSIEFDGTGNAEGCLEIINEYVYEVEPFRCFPKPCAIGSVYQPTIQDAKEFYAIGAFLYPIRSFGLMKSSDSCVTPQQIMDEANSYCAQPFQKAKDMSNESGEYVSGNCLMGMYTAQLFMKAYGFEPETCQIQVLNETYAAKMNWPMGALLYEIFKDNDILCAYTGAVRGKSAAVQHLHIVLYILLVLTSICIL